MRESKATGTVQIDSAVENLHHLEAFCCLFEMDFFPMTDRPLVSRLAWCLHYTISLEWPTSKNSVQCARRNCG